MGNILELDNFLTTAFENKFRDQEVDITLYLPEGTVLFADQNTYNFHRNHYSQSSFRNKNTGNTRNINNNTIMMDGMEGHYLQILNKEIKCLDCPDDFELDSNDENSRIRIDKEGIKIKNNGNSVEINQDGIKSKSERVKVNIDNNGIKITSDDN